MPSESLPLTVLQEIDRVCDSFEAAWHAGLKPRIEDYLNVTTLEYRTQFFGELLAREVELRKKAGESPEAADYVPRFACYGELILTVINQSGQAGLTVVLPLTSSDAGSDSHLSGNEPPPTEPGSTYSHGMNWHPGASSRKASIVVPDRIGRFRVVGLLGQGNFLVFLAHDDQKQTEVAIKVARPDDPFSRRRLMSLADEAQRLAALNHPGIVKIHEFVTPPADAIAEQEGGPGGFIVLEYVPGLNLEELFRQTRMTPARLAQITAEVADAIHHAHTLGLVHRDLKPSNILIDAHGHPRVCDFGLAIDEEIQRLRRGEVAGTLPYMAPEQVRGETNRLDGRTDIWALGVILYRGLTGRQPFRGDRAAEYFDEILNREPRPPRQFSDDIPRELERICLRCLSRQMSDRYLTAADLADDLRRWLFEASREPTTATTPAPILPKGLHTFDSQDAGFFLTLLPGPRGSDGLPESVRFWKRRIEGEERDFAFSIGVIYSPSGGGKSSFVKAGLIPSLDRARVRPIAVEATPHGTEDLLLSELRRVVPQLPRECNLPEAIALLRDDPHIRSREKILLVLDQFEQWLQGRPIEPSAELVRALRQCDGRRVQTLLLVRDDFWMALTRLLRAVEVPLVEGANAAAVELFDRRHARKVLEEYGRSLGQLPAGELPAGGEAAVFLDRAVDGLTGPDGRVIPVRLSLFVEVVRNRPWTAHTLRVLGGMEGIGVKFLEEALDSPLAAPAHRVHRRAATAVLQLLLPAPLEVLRGSPRSGRELREAAGYDEHSGDFADLLQVLGHDLRLITSVDDTGAETKAATVPLDPPHETHYQLAHDYLILPIRQWLDRKQRSTRAGRARRRLQAITAAWLERPGARQLPSVFEYAGILRNTRPGDWTSEERRLMRAATWHLLRRVAAAGALLAAVVIGGKELIDQQDARYCLRMTLVADDRELAARIAELLPYQHRVIAELQAGEGSPRLKEHEREVTGILLYRFSPTARRGRYLRALLLEAATPNRVRVVRGVLAAHREFAGLDELRQTLADGGAEPHVRLRAACALAVLDSARLQELGPAAPVVARAILDEGARSIPGWLNLLDPALEALVEPLSQLCRDSEVHQGLGITAAEALAEILKRRRDTKTLAAILVDSRPDSALILLRELAKLAQPREGIDFLRTVLDQRVQDLAGESAKDLLAGRQALAAIALDALGEPDVLWTRLRHDPDPRARALLIDRLAELSLSRQRILARLIDPVIDPGERQALLLIWAESPRGNVTAPMQAEVLQAAHSLFLDDPDPGVHSAAELLIHRWDGVEPVTQNGQQPRLRLTGPNRPSWKVGPNGHAFAIIPGPLVFSMGSPDLEEGRLPEEQLHFRRIDRSIAVATKEVTIEQFRAFDPRRGPDRRFTHDRKCPVNGVFWFDAARYCNWLSAQDQIPEEQWCYPDASDESMAVPERSVERIGYRLPTEAEWEYLCRAGTVTSRPFGVSEELLPRHGWTWLNSRDRARPVGQLLPNPFGLFDMLGNLWEWCHDGRRAGKEESPHPYPTGTSPTHPAPDDVAGGAFTNDTRRMLRGGAFDYSPAQARSASRYLASPGYTEGTYGFRIVRTLPAGRDY